MNKFLHPARFACLAIALSLTAPVMAQSKKELAAKVAQAQTAEAEALARMLAGQSLQGPLQSVTRALQSVPQDKRDALVKEVEGELRKSGQEIETELLQRVRKLAPSAYASVLEEKMTEDELKQTLAWLESSAYRKQRVISPEIQNTLAQKLVADARPSVDAKLKSLDEKLRKSFGMPPAPAASASK